MRLWSFLPDIASLGGVQTKPGQAEAALPKRLRELRRATGLTQEGFAEKSGFSYKYYQKIERGQSRNLRLRTLEKLAIGYGITLAKLFTMPATGKSRRG